MRAETSSAFHTRHRVVTTPLYRRIELHFRMVHTFSNSSTSAMLVVLSAYMLFASVTYFLFSRVRCLVCLHFIFYSTHAHPNSRSISSFPYKPSYYLNSQYLLYIVMFFMLLYLIYCYYVNLFDCTRI